MLVLREMMAVHSDPKRTCCLKRLVGTEDDPHDEARLQVAEAGVKIHKI